MFHFCLTFCYVLVASFHKLNKQSITKERFFKVILKQQIDATPVQRRHPITVDMICG
jgi:hypothetical protein